MVAVWLSDQATTPGGRPLLRLQGRSLNRPGALSGPVPGADGPRRVHGWAHRTTGLRSNASDAAGVTDPHRAPRPRTGGASGRWLRDGRALPRRSGGRNVERGGGPQRRSLRCRGAGATLWPSWSPLVRSACSAAARFGEHGAAWAIRRVSVNRADVPKSYQRLAGTALGAPTNRPRSIEAGRPRRPLRALWGHGPDRTVTAAPSEGRSPARSVGRCAPLRSPAKTPPAVVATKSVRAHGRRPASGTAPPVWLPLDHRGA